MYVQKLFEDKTLYIFVTICWIGLDFHIPTCHETQTHVSMKDYKQRKFKITTEKIEKYQNTNFSFSCKKVRTSETKWNILVSLTVSPYSKNHLLRKQILKMSASAPHFRLRKEINISPIPQPWLCNQSVLCNEGNNIIIACSWTVCFWFLL